MPQAVCCRPLTTEAWESDHVGSVVDNVALGQILLTVLRVSHVNIIPP
jgi:hypothetical protein